MTGARSKHSLSPTGSEAGSTANEDTVRNNFAFQKSPGGSRLPPLMLSESRQGEGRAKVNQSTSPAAHRGMLFNKSQNLDFQSIAGSVDHPTKLAQSSLVGQIIERVQAGKTKKDLLRGQRPSHQPILHQNHAKAPKS